MGSLMVQIAQLLAALVAILTFCFTFGPSGCVIAERERIDPPITRATIQPGSVEVVTTPSGARVCARGVFMGTTPCHIRRPAGPAEVVAYHDGFVPAVLAAPEPGGDRMSADLVPQADSAVPRVLLLQCPTDLRHRAIEISAQHGFQLVDQVESGTAAVGRSDCERMLVAARAGTGFGMTVAIDRSEVQMKSVDTGYASLQAGVDGISDCTVNARCEIVELGTGVIRHAVAGKAKAFLTRAGVPDIETEALQSAFASLGHKLHERPVKGAD